jgi:hypothetical protein
MNVFSLHANQIDDVWPHLAPLLGVYERRCKALTAEQVYHAAKASRQQIFGLQDGERVHGLVVTEIQSTARGPVCELVAACGLAPNEDKRQILHAIEEWAREIGCVAVRLQGRKGWLRFEPRLRQTGIVAELRL